MKKFQQMVVGILLSFAFVLSSSAVAREIVLGALGDSVTKGSNSGRFPGHNPENSWSTGSDIESHANKLRKHQLKVRTVNKALPGAQAIGIRSQIEELLPHDPDFVTLMVGANDACNWTPENSEAEILEFGRRVSISLQMLIDFKPTLKVLLLPIPDMYRIWEVAHDHGGPLAWGSWGFCPRLLGSNRTEAERRAFKARVDRANEFLEDVAAPFVDRVLFNSEVDQVQFELRHVSRIDFFHPSLEGQKLISEKTWNPSFYNLE